MTSVFRMIFDISVYYAITGIYLQAFSDKLPFVPGFVLLCVAVLLFGIWQLKDRAEKFKVYFFLLPLIGLAFRPEIIDMIQLLPVWLYAGIVLMKDLADIDMKAFKKRLVQAILLILGSLIPLILTARPIFRYLGNVLPYVIVMIADGVICFRSLHDRSGSLQHLIVVSLFTAVCTMLCYFQLPQKLLGLFRDQVLLKILDAIENLFRFSRETTPMEQTKQSGYRTELKPSSNGEDALGEFGTFNMSETTVNWLKTIFYMILGVAIVVVVVLLVIRLIKGLRHMDRPERQRTWKDEVVRIRKSDRKSATKRRKIFGDNRMTVRYYYWRYMRECEKQGISVGKGWTAEELAQVSRTRFEEEDVTAMQRLYNPVRYDDHTEVTGKQAKQAAKLWQNLKRNKSK